MAASGVVEGEEGWHGGREGDEEYVSVEKGQRREQRPSGEISS